MRQDPIHQTLLLLCAAGLIFGSLACAGTDADPGEQPVAAAAGDRPGGLPNRPQPGGREDRKLALPMKNLNAAAGGPETVSLAAVTGSKPVILYYWIAGNPRADQGLVEIQKLVEGLGDDKVALYALVHERDERDVQAVSNRVQSLGIRVPVLSDAGFTLGKTLRVRSVPNIAMFDADGELRLANGASLKQEIEYNTTLSDTIRRAAETGKVGNYGYLPAYYPVKELVGRKCPDFSAPFLDEARSEQPWSSLMDDEKLNVLIFWSVDCPHCRTSLPEINAWLKQNGEGMNVVTAARVVDEATRAKTHEFCELNEFIFPTLQDRDLQIANLFQVTTTPTIVLIRPDGVVDSVLLSSDKNVGDKLAQKRRELL